ncbi:MAG: hypothetical protein FWC50_01670 [Planctomycetaceae bacterium]|nr:hypothetical protein [Planctomycetaceae bacterium]
MFRFRLQPLQKIRENVRRNRQTELAKALEAEAVVRERLEGVKHEIKTTKEEGRRLAVGGEVNVDYLIGLRRHEAFLLAQKTTIEEHLEKLIAEVERRRQAVIEADKEVRIMEKFHDKLKERYDSAIETKEIAEFDEIANVRSARSRMSPDEQGSCDD